MIVATTLLCILASGPCTEYVRSSSDPHQQRIKVADGHRSYVLVTPRNPEHAAAMEAMSRGEWNRALGLLLAIADDFPGDDIVAMQIADAAFRVSEPRVAYNAVRPYLENEKLRTRLQGATLRGFLAGLEIGVIDERLREFAVAHVKLLGRGLGDEFVAELPQGDTSRELQLLTSIALGLHCGWVGERGNSIYYLTRARGLDSGNPVVSLALGRALVDAKEFAAARDVLQAGLTRSSGRLREALRSEIELAVRHGVEDSSAWSGWRGIGGS